MEFIAHKATADTLIWDSHNYAPVVIRTHHVKFTHVVS
jgi:hypothetical protein